MTAFAINLYYNELKEAEFMNFRTNLLIIKNKAKLNKMIAQEAPYDKILKQSKLLDKYIIEQMQDMMNKRS